MCENAEKVLSMGNCSSIIMLHNKLVLVVAYCELKLDVKWI